MQEQFLRTTMLLGQENIDKLKKARVAIFGVGGVGGYAVEALARSGIGKIDLIDNDIICITNINRQIIATYKTIGKYKVDVMKERILDINPDCEVKIYKTFYLPENRKNFNFNQYDYIIDAIDTVTSKIDLAIYANENNINIISAMGAGNKLDPCKFEISDIYKTEACPLAKIMRRELKKRGVKKLKVVYSKEKALKPIKELLQFEEKNDISSKRRATPGSIAFVPSVVGLIIASEVIKDLLN